MVAALRPSSGARTSRRRPLRRRPLRGRRWRYRPCRVGQHRHRPRRGPAAAFATVVTAVTVAVLAVTTAACAGPVPPPAADSGTALDQPIPASVADLPLVDSAGHRTDLAAYRGKVLVISDMMTLCQETCPLDTATIVATARQVERDGLAGKVEFASITIDPARDTTARLAAYRRLFAPPPGDWAVLGGPPASLSALWRYLGLYYQRAPEGSPPGRDWLTGRPLTYDISHADLVYFVGPDGHLRFTMDGVGHVAAAADLPAALRRFLSGQGRARLGDPGPGSWTVAQALAAIGWLADTRVPAPGGSG